MTPAEAFIVGRLGIDGCKAFRVAAGMGVSEATFPSPDGALVWRTAAKLDADGGDWDGVALLAALERVQAEADWPDKLAPLQETAFSGAYLPYHVGKLLSEAWRRNALAAADGFRGALASGGAAAEAWCKLATAYSSGTVGAKVHWMTAGEILDAAEPPEEYLIFPWLCTGKMSALVGAGGTGKTRFYIWALSAMMAGHPAVGSMPIPKRTGGGKWLVVAGNENGLRRLQTDLRAIVTAFPGAVEEIRRRLCFHVAQDGDVPMDADALPWVETKVRELGEDCEGVVFDPLSDFLPPGESLNEDAAMKGLCVRLFDMVKRAAPKAAVLLVHHARGGREAILKSVDSFESGEAGRNSRMLAATVRSVLNLVPYDEAGGVVGVVGKLNDARKPPPFALRLVEGVYQREQDFNLERWAEDVRQGTKRESPASVSAGGGGEDVAALLVPGERVSAGTLEARAAKAGLSRRTFYRHLEKAVTDGLVVKDELGYLLAEGEP